MSLKIWLEGNQRLVFDDQVEETEAFGGFEIWVREDIMESGGIEIGQSRGIEGVQVGTY